jgi:homocitrate synthase
LLYKLKDIEELVAKAVEVNIHFDNYITGVCAFAHKAGIHAKAILNNPSTYKIINPADFEMTRYVHVSTLRAITGFIYTNRSSDRKLFDGMARCEVSHAVKSRVEQLNIEMTDEQIKFVTAQVKKLADLRTCGIGDVDAIIQAFHRGIPLTEALPTLTKAEKAVLAGNEVNISSNGVSNEAPVAA